MGAGYTKLRVHAMKRREKQLNETGSYIPGENNKTARRTIMQPLRHSPLSANLNLTVSSVCSEALSRYRITK